MASTVPVSYLTTPAPHSTRFAYRLLGPPSPPHPSPATPPLVLHIHFRANMSFWDPLFLSTLSASRTCIIFDQPGTGLSSGEVKDTFEGWAEDLCAFVDASGLTQIDLLGFSMGGCAAQAVALARPGLVRRLVLAGTTGPTARSVTVPREVAPREPIKLLAGAQTREEMERAIVVSFFNRSEGAARDYLDRVRGSEVAQLGLLGQEGTKRQREAYMHWDTPVGEEKGEGDQLGELQMPVLVLNGDEDLLIPTSRSWELMTRIENAKLVIYPRAGHGFIWQYAEQVAKEVCEFLDAEEGVTRAKL